MAPQAKSAVKVVFGAMPIGTGQEQSRVFDLSDAGKTIDIFQSYGHDEVDTSRFYGSGSSEEYPAKLQWEERGLVIDTKNFPSAGKRLEKDNWTLRPEHLREVLMQSLKALNVNKIHMWYLHAPDRTTPITATLQKVNNLHKEGLFEKFALSNYMG